MHLAARSRVASERVRPPVPAPLAAATAGAFAFLSALRGRRVVHPDGVAFAGELTLAAPEEFLETRSRRLPVVVRLSRGLGLPRALPDVLGLAVKLPDFHGAGRDQDFLCVTSAAGPLFRHLILPATSFFGRWFSSILFYRFERRLLLVGAAAAVPPAPAADPFDELRATLAEGALRFTLGVAAPWRPWRPIGTLALSRELAAEAGDALAFSPWHTGGRLRPVGPWNALRHPAYVGSQEGRTRMNRRGAAPRPSAGRRAG